MPEYLTPTEVADLLRVNRRLLDAWRHEGRGPSYVRVEGNIRYPRVDFEAYIASRTVAVATR